MQEVNTTCDKCSGKCDEDSASIFVDINNSRQTRHMCFACCQEIPFLREFYPEEAVEES